MNFTASSVIFEGGPSCEGVECRRIGTDEIWHAGFDHCPIEDFVVSIPKVYTAAEALQSPFLVLGETTGWILSIWAVLGWAIVRVFQNWYKPITPDILETVYISSIKRSISEHWKKAHSSQNHLAGPRNSWEPNESYNWLFSSEGNHPSSKISPAFLECPHRLKKFLRNVRKSGFQDTNNQLPFRANHFISHITPNLAENPPGLIWPKIADCSKVARQTYIAKALEW